MTDGLGDRRSRRAPHHRLADLLLGCLLVGVILAFGDLGEPALSTGDEALTALRARGLIEQGGWWTPYWNGDVDLHKPPLYFWLAGAAFRLFGIGELAVRLPSVLAFLALLFVVYRFSRRLFDPWVGVLAAVLTAAHPFLFSQSRVGTLDTTMILFSVLAISALSLEDSPRALVGWGLCCGLAMLTKASAATPVLLASLIYVLALRRELLSSPAFHGSLALAVILPGIWFGSQLLLHSREVLGPHYHDMMTYRFQPHTWRSRFVSLRHLWMSWGGLAPLFFAAPLLIWAPAPGSGGGVRSRKPTAAALPSAVSLLYLFGVVTLAAVMSIRHQMSWYCLPVVVPIAIFAAKLLVDLLRGETSGWVVVLAGSLMAAGTVLPAAYLPETWFSQGVRAAALVACVMALGGDAFKTGARVSLCFGIVLAVAGGLSVRNRHVNFHRPRDSSPFRYLASVLCDKEEFPGPLIVNFRHFPQNALMFYSDRDTVQLHRLSASDFPRGERRCALVWEGEGHEPLPGGFDVEVIRKIGDFSVLSVKAEKPGPP